MREVLSKIKPSKKEAARLKKVSGKLQAEIERIAKKIDSRAHAAVLGSASRGTWLRYEKDIDVFLIMPLEYEKKELEEIVTKIGKKVLKKTEKRYAEHPYIKGFYDGFEVEIVPCYAIKTPAEMKSAVDRTPFHDEFVKKNIKAKENEVRLLKQFLAGIGCYGAEAKVEGFSGYLCELLVIKYGSFKKVLKAASGWKAGKVIGIGARPAGIVKKFKSPLVFIDPVDPKRNVASALSEQKFNTFVAAAGAFLKSPRKEFFFPRKRKVVKSELAARLEERGTDIVGIVFRAPDVIDDILYTQLRRALKIIVGVLEREEFSVVGRDFFVENGRIFLLIELDSIELSASRLHTGPPANSEH
ncbi:MAG: CCA tRNA nucleotidyltransferase, partial [Candidatus Hydrothermarchaeaceae archaeon]